MDARYLLLLLGIINLAAYFLMWKDKRAAIKRRWRVPEKTLYLIGLFFGAIGLFLGTRTPLFHKRSKIHFMRIMYLLVALNLIGLIAITTLLFSRFSLT